jgi:glycosyltransferase involved in cell wall biosynthesis
MGNPKVSIIIPVYNGEKTLGRCLTSVLNQDYKDYEVIVVDNNSTDKTQDIIKGFQKKDAKVKYVFESAKGRGAARNTGINNSSGDIIAMTDADCIVPRDWLRQLTRPIIYENESAVMGGEKKLNKNYWSTNIQNANLQFLKRNTDGNYISFVDTKNFAIKASIIKDLMFDGRFEAFEDLDFYLRLKRGVRIRFVPSITVAHSHKNSFKEVVKLNFDRAYWTAKIYKKFVRVKGIRKELMFESISIKNFLLFPFWMILQFLTKPITRAYFILVSELSWRSGIIWGMINNGRQPHQPY